MVLRHRAPPVLSSSLLRLPGGISRHAPRRAIPPFNLGRPAMNGFEPAYLALDRRGELEERARRALVLLGPERCVVCPRECKVDRLADHPGLCRVGRQAVVASHFPHFGEENCLRGWKGSGTIFFSGCNLRCVFCQNHEISYDSLDSLELMAEIVDIYMPDFKLWSSEQARRYLAKRAYPEVAPTAV